LPWEVQYDSLRKIEGLENAKIFRPGYAIEYDYYPPMQLKHNLETRIIENLFFAGQINGTTGYEEAGAQGIIAGINAAMKVSNEGEFILSRDQAYIGVLIDDLITKGVDEPYRMFTSRAEYRLLLRQDDADERLTKLSYNIGLAKKERLLILNKKLEIKKNLLSYLSTESVPPENVNDILKQKNTSSISQKVKAVEILKRPQIQLEDLIPVLPELDAILQDSGNLRAEIIEAAEINIKYKGYIEREKLLADKIGRLESIKIPSGIDYSILKSISTEARQKLGKQKPETIGVASRISGVSPSDISVILLYMGR
jgi:tRNA uridine 5-carboxymethylaminomethyl modification enzyme